MRIHSVSIPERLGVPPALPPIIRAIVLVTIVLLPAGGAASGAISQNHGHGSHTSAKVPPKDHFTGQVTSATGRYRSEHGRMTLDLHLSSSRPNGNVRIAALACQRPANCLRLHGTLRVTSVTRLGPPIPDVGLVFGLKLRGNLFPLGKVTASGTVSTPGFVRQAREWLTLTLKSGQGNVKVAGQSGLVPGFTTP